MFQYFPVKGFYVEAGPQLGLLTNASVKIENGDKIGRTSDYNTADVALNIGAGVHATPQLGFFARYGFGLTDVTKNDNATYTNMVGQVGATLRLYH